MDAALLSASSLWHLCPTPTDQLLSPIFHGAPHAVKEVNRQTRGKELHHAINLTGYKSGTLENTKKSLFHLK